MGESQRQVRLQLEISEASARTAQRTFRFLRVRPCRAELQSIKHRSLVFASLKALTPGRCVPWSSRWHYDQRAPNHSEEQV